MNDYFARAEMRAQRNLRRLESMLDRVDTPEQEGRLLAKIVSIENRIIAIAEQTSLGRTIH